MGRRGAAAGTRQPGLDPAAVSPPCIAVVDADRVTLDRTAGVLALDGYPAICFRMAADAAAPIQQRRPELVIVDLQRQWDAGWQLIVVLRQHPSTAQIPILVWSADPQAGAMVDLCRLTGVLVQDKPLRSHHLLALVARLALVR